MLISGILQFVLHGDALDYHSETATSPVYKRLIVIGVHWLAGSLWVQFKDLTVFFTALHDLRHGYFSSKWNVLV